MDKCEIKKEIYSLKREHNLDDKMILKTLVKLSADLNTIRETQCCIELLNSTNKRRIKENSLAAIQRNHDIDQMRNHYLSTFIVAIVFLIVGEVIDFITFDIEDEFDALKISLFTLAFLGSIVYIAINRLLKKNKKKNHIYQYKLIKYIENMDTN